MLLTEHRSDDMTLADFVAPSAWDCVMQAGGDRGPFTMQQHQSMSTTAAVKPMSEAERDARAYAAPQEERLTEMRRRHRHINSG
jgi:hypothetical protein